MVRLLPYIYVTIQTALVTGMISRWLHIRHVRKMTRKFTKILEDTIGILTDNPAYTVKVKQIKVPKHTKAKAEVYDWKLDEQFDKIIDNNFPQQ